MQPPSARFAHEVIGCAVRKNKVCVRDCRIFMCRHECRCARVAREIARRSPRLNGRGPVTQAGLCGVAVEQFSARHARANAHYEPDSRTASTENESAVLPPLTVADDAGLPPSAVSVAECNAAPALPQKGFVAVQRKFPRILARWVSVGCGGHRSVIFLSCS